MATVNNTVRASYTNLADIKSYWMNTIAPNYLNFNNVNNYNIGIFGYVNEVMANTTEDAFNAIAIARREAYPVTAQFTSSMYAMATLQSIEIPLTTPATCKCALIIPQNEIIENSIDKNNSGLYECTIDNCLKIFAGDLQFMLDYPIKIISKKSDQWTHTIHYDVSVSNSLNKSSDGRYISNKIIKDSGVSYVVLFLDVIRQLEMQEITQVVVKDSIMDTITMDIDFDGNLANFEVFYKENANSDEIQLTKVMVNAATPSSAYVQYELVNSNRIRLIFSYNKIFIPKYNSEIICRVYTSRGSEGNFNSFAEDLVCSSDSEKYPYNASMTILGKVNGSATGGADQLITEEFRNSILKAYSTNNTITTSNDLQLHFDNLANTISNVKVLFKKKRDDPLIRLFGAYSVLKDDGKNTIPTNTLNIELLRSDIDKVLSTANNRLSIKSGTIFEYKNADSYVLTPSKNADGSLKSFFDIKQDTSGKMYFVNPFLIGINISPNNIGYYMNSINNYLPIEYTYVNDNSSQQFIGSTFSIYRNTINGSNYYRFRITLTPATDMNYNNLITINDSHYPSNQIRAEYNGRVVKDEYYFDQDKNESYVRYAIQYDTSIEDKKIQYIQASNTVPIGKESTTGYEMLFNVGDEFIAGDIIAVKRVSDMGKLLICGDLNYNLHSNNYYIPFSIQGYDEDVQSYIMEAYLATDDEIDLSEKLIITHGIYNKNSINDQNISIDMRNQIIVMNVLFDNSIISGNNITNKYSTFAGLNTFTLTNTYISNENQKFDFIGSLPYIRSVVDFKPGGTSDNDYKITITESPMIGAKWGANVGRYDYFVSKYKDINSKLNSAYYSLENNFSIDSKFYNTYGKAKFFTVGNNVESMEKLDSVKCKFHFGVKLNIITSTDQFINNLRSFIKDYIENDTKITTSGQDLYIMNMISEIRSNFSEISYIEYYGFNKYKHEAQKVIGPDLTDFQGEFIPEYLNLDTLTDPNGEAYPNIIVDILN